MTTPRNIVNFENGETLTPSKLNIGFERIHTDLIATSSKKYIHGSIAFDFTGITDTSRQIDRQVDIRYLRSFEVTAVELVLYQATGNVTSVTLVNTGMGNWKAPVVTPAGATVRSRDTKEIVEYVSALTTFELQVTASGTPWTLGRCYAIVHYKHEVPGSSDFTERTSPRFASGETLAAAKLNTAFTDYETELAAILTSLPRFSVVHFWRDLIAAPAASDVKIRVPDSARTFQTIEVYQTGDTGNNVTATLYDELGASIGGATANGATGTKVNASTVLNHTQDEDDPADYLEDYYILLSRTGAVTIPLVYAILREV